MSKLVSWHVLLSNVLVICMLQLMHILFCNKFSCFLKQNKRNELK